MSWPIIFILYLNHFEKRLIRYKAGPYAEDTHVIVKSTIVENLFQKTQMEVSNVSTWMWINRLSANSKKNYK